MTAHRHAFSLVELSIVLVIVGLLVGGVFAGKSLLRASELRNITKEYEYYRAAVMAFDSKYGALPGDMPNAVEYWGAQAGGTADGPDSACYLTLTPAPDKATCNGDGDGKIGENYMSMGTDYYKNHKNYEPYRFWQHLANAGMIEGTYSGVPSKAISDSEHFGDPMLAGTNMPRSKIDKNVMWTFRWGGEIPNEGIYANIQAFYIPRGSHGNIAAIANPSVWNEGYDDYALLTPTEAWQIDTKIDDGKPGLGKLFPYHALGENNCATGVPSYQYLTSTYNITNNEKLCALLFVTGF